MTIIIMKMNLWKYRKRISNNNMIYDDVEVSVMIIITFTANSSLLLSNIIT